jgi:hypothetical protein
VTTPFSIQFSGLPAVPFATYGLAKPLLSIASQEQCRLSFTADGAAMDSNAPNAEGQICKVLYNGTPFFSGRLFRISRKGSPNREAIEYQVLDPWNDLERVVYQQQWTSLAHRDENGNPTTAANYVSELILGMDINGNSLTSGQVIADVINWARTCGANLQLGFIGVAAPIPRDQVTDLPCSEVIRRMLRWTPDSVAWFDYTKTPPAFNITRRGQCQPLELPFVGAVEKQDIEALPELRPPVVVVNYLQTNTSNDGPSELQITPDVWPPEASPTQLGAAILSCRLAGAQSTYQRQPVTVARFPQDDGGNPVNSAGAEGGPANDPVIRWWQRKVPWLQNLGTPGTYDAADVGNQLDITNVYGTYQIGQGDDDGTGDIQVSLTDYPNELTVGSVASWMGVRWAKCNWSALVKYSYPSSTADYSSQDWDAVNVFGPDEGSGFSATCLVTAVATMTNASTKTYTQQTGYIAPEPVPAELAEQIYSSVAALQYRGSYTVVAQDSTPAALGCVLNLSGGRGEWATMNALVQKIDQELDTGRTTLRFGSYGHLTLQDLMELIRASRTHITASRSNERKTGQADEGSPIDGPAQGPSDGGGSPPSHADTYPWIGDQISDWASDTEEHPPYDAQLGYGQASFVGGGEIVNPDPIRCFGIGTGNCGDGFDDGEYSSADDATAGFLLISGDDTADNDILAMYEQDGSVEISPNAPSIELFPGLNGGVPDGIDHTSDGHIMLDFSTMLIEITDSDSSKIALDLSDSPIVKVENANTSNHSYLDENSLTCYDDGEGCTIEADAGSDYIKITDSAGAYVMMSVDTDAELYIEDTDGAYFLAKTDDLILYTSDGSKAEVQPTQIDLYDAGDSSSCEIQTSSITLDDGGGNTIYLDAGAPSITLNADSDTSILSASSLGITSSEGDSELSGSSLTLADSDGNTISIDVADTGGHSMSVQEIQICVDGSAKTIKILASAPY